MKASIRIALQPGSRVLYVEREPSRIVESPPFIDYADYNERVLSTIKIRKMGYWTIPQSTNPDRTLGIFLRLYDNGKVERVTIRDNEADDIVLIKPEDGRK